MSAGVMCSDRRILKISPAAALVEQKRPAVLVPSKFVPKSSFFLYIHVFFSKFGTFTRLLTLLLIHLLTYFWVVCRGTECIRRRRPPGRPGSVAAAVQCTCIGGGGARDESSASHSAGWRSGLEAWCGDQCCQYRDDQRAHHRQAQGTAPCYARVIMPFFFLQFYVCVFVRCFMLFYLQFIIRSLSPAGSRLPVVSYDWLACGT